MRNKRVKVEQETPDEESVAKASQELVQDSVTSHVVMHLDRDPNDPRNRPETRPLPSLDD